MKTTTHCELEELPRSKLWLLQNEEFNTHARLTRMFAWGYVLVNIVIVAVFAGYVFHGMYEHNQKLERLIKKINTPLFTKGEDRNVN